MMMHELVQAPNGVHNGGGHDQCGYDGQADDGEERSHHEWNVEEVCTWVSSLGFTTDYTRIIRDNDIDGFVVDEMTADEWRGFGLSFGHSKTIVGRWKKL
eukprot:TRINITY_DN14097_c0_g1_i1.p2 TRINITY_DN14097_c0_g1~~TRINITY_DN14097_c0_g1_i1.p2  ORF type:complete len:100 (-),score=16.36 TRINITY_DN14097_c0_g1_i1:268-567(-)